MSPTPSTRDAVRTRQAILDGAGRALVTHGPGVSLDAVAVEAGVSKGGVLHHFGNKDELIRALAAEFLDTFRAAVTADIDLSENQPGKVLRAYVRAVVDQVRSDFAAFRPRVWGVLGTIPEVGRLLQADSDHWRAAFRADGLDEDQVTLIWRAADGLLAASTYDERIDDAEAVRVGELLTRLSYPATPA